MFLLNKLLAFFFRSVRKIMVEPIVSMHQHCVHVQCLSIIMFDAEVHPLGGAFQRSHVD